MIINKALNRYRTQVYDQVFKYAYENYNMGPIMEIIDIDGWFGKIYEVANMDNDLHLDIRQDLQAMGSYWNIKKGDPFDRYVILPDVFSAKKIPLNKTRNEYDFDRRQIVFINGYVFDLAKYHFRHMMYNHNKKTYIFYNSAEAGDIFSKGNKLQVLWMYDFAYMYDQMKWNWWEEERLHININKDNKLIFIKAGNLGIGKLEYNAILGAGATADEYVGIAPLAPFIEFDYEEAAPDPTIVRHVPGLFSFTPDDWVMEPLYGVDEYDNAVYFHDRSVIFSNTALIVYRDNSYTIDNFHLTNGQGKIIRKIDKHTIVMPKDPEEKIWKIFVFTRPFNYKGYDRIDTVYDAAMSMNNRAFLAMEPHKKWTNTLYDMMVIHNPSLEEVIDYGYKFDRDVLKVIQTYFKVVNELDLKLNFDIVTESYGKKLRDPMILVRSVNRLGLRPLVFINDLMVMSDITIVNGYDVDEILIDTTEILKILDPDFKIDNSECRKKKRDFEYVNKVIRDYIKCIHVAYVPMNELNKQDSVYGLQPGRLLRKPVYRGELIYDSYGGWDEDDRHNRYIGSQFVNGRLNAEKFTYNKNNVVSNTGLFRTLEGIETFDFDDGIRTFKTSVTTNDRDIYCPTHKLKDGTYSIYRNDTDMTLLINRTTEKLRGLSKAYLCDQQFELRYETSQSYETVTRVAPVLKERSTLLFDKFGILANDHCEVLSDHYLSLINAKNYVHHPELDDAIVLHGFALYIRNPVNGIDLEIDESRINQDLNIGSFNEACMADDSIRGLFNPNIPEDLNRPIPIELKSREQLLGEKILTRYWLGPMGRAYDTALLSQEVGILNGKYINTDGSLGVIPDINKPFVENRSYSDDQVISLNEKLCGKSVIYNMLINSGLAPKPGSYVVDNAYIDCNKKDYTGNTTAKMDHYLNQKNTESAITDMNFDIDDRILG